MPEPNSALAGVPESGRQRLATMRGDAEHARLFTSDLSVSEFLLVRDAGFEPLGLVMGTSIFHIGLQRTNPFRNQELAVLTQAMYRARELAMARMEAEADALLADGIVGVRLEVSRRAWGEHLAEFMAVGTAVRQSTGERYRTGQGRPFTSDLSGQDFWTLLRSGYRPLSMVIGNCVYHVAHRRVTQVLRQFGVNSEMQNYTQALYDARELALTRMQAEASAAGAQGIIGGRVEEHSHGWENHVVEYLAIGTAIAPTSSATDAPPGAEPLLILPLDR